VVRASIVDPGSNSSFDFLAFYDHAFNGFTSSAFFAFIWVTLCLYLPLSELLPNALDLSGGPQNVE
jgi:hypothetical protein